MRFKAEGRWCASKRVSAAGLLEAATPLVSQKRRVPLVGWKR